jgi:hypothetical protein
MTQKTANQLDFDDIEVNAIRLWQSMGIQAIEHVTNDLNKALLQGSINADYLLHLLVCLKHICADEAKQISHDDQAAHRRPN